MLRHQPVDVPVNGFAVTPKMNLQVAIARVVRGDIPHIAQRLDIAQTADLIKAFIPFDGLPDFALHGDHPMLLNGL